MSVQWFDKYERFGPYHWKTAFGPWWRVDPRLTSLYRAALGAVEERIKLGGARGLDVGCGEGVMLRLCGEQGARMIGLDGMEGAVRFASALLGACRLEAVLIRADAQELPFADNSFDFVTCLEVIEHLERPEAFLSEVRRVLKAPGVLVLSTPLARNGGVRDPYHVKEYSAEELRTALTSAGFGDLKLTGLHPAILDRLYYRATGLRRLDRWVRAGFKLIANCAVNPYVVSRGAASERYATVVGVAVRGVRRREAPAAACRGGAVG